MLWQSLWEMWGRPPPAVCCGSDQTSRVEDDIIAVHDLNPDQYTKRVTGLYLSVVRGLTHLPNCTSSWSVALVTL